MYAAGLDGFKERADLGGDSLAIFRLVAIQAELPLFASQAFGGVSEQGLHRPNVRQHEGGE